jgi:hypothetical protein
VNYLIAFDGHHKRDLAIFGNRFLDFSLKLLRGQLAGFVQPDCTIKALASRRASLASSTPFVHPTSFNSLLACGGKLFRE